MLDLSKPLEAVEKATGRVVPVTFGGRGTRHYGLNTETAFHTKESPADDTNDNWYLDGRDYCYQDKWLIRNRGENLGDILANAIAANERKRAMIEIILHAPRNSIGLTTRKISNIKALREATRERTSQIRDEYGNYSGTCMGLADAKAAIEAIALRGSIRLRMTPAQYGHFMVNRHDLSDYDWQVKSSKYVSPEPEQPPLFTL